MFKKVLIVCIIFVCLMSGCALPFRPGTADYQESRRLIDQGALYLREGKVDQAQACFEVAYELTQSAGSLDGLGCVAFRKGDLDLAEKYFLQAYQSDIHYNNSLTNLALVFEMRGDKINAAKIYETALTEDPKNYRLRNNYAGFLGQSNDYDPQRIKNELLKAQVLLDHPLIQGNIQTINEVK